MSRSVRNKPCIVLIGFVATHQKNAEVVAGAHIGAEGKHSFLVY